MQEPMVWTGVHGTPEGLEWAAAMYECRAALAEYRAAMPLAGPITPEERTAGGYYDAAIRARDAAYERYAGTWQTAA